MVSEPRPAAHYVRFLALAGGVVLLLLGVGYMPTRRLAGDEGLPAMAAGCAVSFAAAAMAAGLVLATPAATPVARMQRALLAMMVRLAIVVGLGAAAVFSGTFPRTPLLFWLATTYVVLLPLEVKLAIRERS